MVLCNISQVPLSKGQNDKNNEYRGTKTHQHVS